MIEEKTAAALKAATARTEQEAAAQSAVSPTMHLKVYSPFKVYFDEEAFSVSAENATGPFDVLAQHHNFITLLSPCEIVIHSVRESEEKIRIAGGLMHVKTDKVTVFLDI